MNIKELRTKLGMTQKAFANLFPSICRENSSHCFATSSFGKTNLPIYQSQSPSTAFEAAKERSKI